MKNGQLKPGYNVQIGTENQFIVGISIHQDAGDTSCLKEYFEELKKELGGKLPSNVVADAGYGSEENYEYLHQAGLGNYVKYNTFHKEASRKWKSDLKENTINGAVLKRKFQRGPVPYFRPFFK